MENAHQQAAYLAAMGIQRWVPVRPVLSPTVDTVTAPTTPVPELVPDAWAVLREQVKHCTLCAGLQHRTQTVFGVGDVNADCLIIGEAPGAEEDRQGEPFVGRAGLLLNEMIKAIGLSRASVFIANILKCRPPSNRDPQKEEVSACFDYLFQQINLLKPKVILSVGRISAQNLLQTQTPVGRLRGVQRLPNSDIPVVVTYHPAYLLRTPSQKRAAWEDLKLLRKILSP